MTTSACTRQADRYGLSLSTSSQRARDAYVEGSDSVLSGGAGAEAHFVGHSKLTRPLRWLTSGWHGRCFSWAKHSRDATPRPRPASWLSMRQLANEATSTPLRLRLKAAPRNHLQLHVNIWCHIHVMQWCWRRQAACSVSSDFRVARAANEEQLEFLRSLAPHYGDDWWFLGMLAFAACECGELDEAWDLIERSRAGNPRNAYVAHNRVHVLLEKGESNSAADYLNEWMADCPKEAILHCHLSWHVALFELELGRPERAWEIYRADVHPGRAWGPPILIATDAPAFLWRSELAGQPRRPDLWCEVREYADRSFPHARIAFADVHRAVAYAIGDHAALEQLTRELREGMETGTLPVGPVTETLVEAFGAFAESDWGRAITLFERALPEIVRIGGSRAQRDLVGHTLVAAYLKAGRAGDAHNLIARRVARRAAVDVKGLEMH